MTFTCWISTLHCCASLSPDPTEAVFCLPQSQEKSVHKFQIVWRKNFHQSTFTLNRCNIPKKLSADCLWSLKKKGGVGGVGGAYLKKKKKLDLESCISSLKRRSLQGLLSKIRSKFSRSLSHVIFESVFFCSFALVVFWIKGLSQMQLVCKQSIHHSKPVPPVPGQGNSSPPALPLQEKHSPASDPSTTRNISWQAAC